MTDNKKDLLERRVAVLEAQMASISQSQQQITAYALSVLLYREEHIANVF